MVAYKLNLMHVEYDSLNVLPIIHNDNAYTRVDNICGNYSGIDIPDGG